MSSEEEKEKPKEGEEEQPQEPPKPVLSKVRSFFDTHSKSLEHANLEWRCLLLRLVFSRSGNPSDPN